MKLIIDRFEGEYAVCEKKNRRMINIHKIKLPSEAREGDVVKIVGTSKGRGFQGVVKRYGFGGGPKSHGQKNRMRAPGSIGSTAPQRVVPGRRMAGRMGTDRITVKNLKVVSIDVEKNQLFLKGAVPGAPQGLILIETVK